MQVHSRCAVRKSARSVPSARRCRNDFSGVILVCPVFWRLKTGVRGGFGEARLQAICRESLGWRNLPKKNCCHFPRFSVVLTSIAPQGAGANCFCPSIAGKKQQTNNIGGTDEV
jgi:hypothetical protein